MHGKEKSRLFLLRPILWEFETTFLFFPRGNERYAERESNESDLLLTGDAGDFREGELEEDLLLVVHHVHPGPVHRNDHIVLRKVGAWEKKRR